MAAEIGLPVATMTPFELKVLCEAPHHAQRLTANDVKLALRFQGFAARPIVPQAVQRYGTIDRAYARPRPGPALTMWDRACAWVPSSPSFLETLTELELRLFVYFTTGQVSLVAGQTVRVFPASARATAPSQQRVERPTPGQLLLPNFATVDEGVRVLSAVLAGAAASS